MEEKEEEEYLEKLETVAEIEKITNETELILQNRSIYSVEYGPKYMHKDSKAHSIKNRNKNAVLTKGNLASIKSYRKNSENNDDNNN